MSEHHYIAVDLSPISRAAYYEARKDASTVGKPFGFVIGRTVYVTKEGKFFKGQMNEEYDMQEIEVFDFLGVDIRPPQAVFQRKAA